MGILAKIFGTGDVIKEGFKLIDELHTSDEEEIQAKNKAKTDLLGAYAPFKLSQRIIAWAFTFTFLLCFFICLVAMLKGMELTGDITELMGIFKIGEIMFIIVLFYFGGGAFEGGFKALKGDKK